MTGMGLCWKMTLPACSLLAENCMCGQVSLIRSQKMLRLIVTLFPTLSLPEGQIPFCYSGWKGQNLAEVGEHYQLAKP